jgi:hypothetical protein
MNDEPSLGTLLTRIEPPISSARRRLMTRPMPVPWSAVRSRPSRLNGRNSSSICSGVIPMPVSVTETSITSGRGQPAGDVDPAVVDVVLDGVAEQVGEDLLDPVASPNTADVPAASSTLIRMPRLAASLATSAVVASTSSARSSVVVCRRRLPESMRDRSRTSLIISSRCQPACWICATHGPLGRRQRMAPVDLEQLGEAEHRVERRAQLVAHAREEVALGAVRDLGRLARAARPPRGAGAR